ncbi:conjugative relaxase domain-containing protein, TrwC/TraI family [Sphingobium sp. YR657]|nr:conjugative relaxase domain-containing protein, TrwC/TraI family [Sphingobium sp. YR657]
MMHPRRLKGSAGNISRYYTVGDYYTKGDAEKSEWGGRLSAELGLEGEVSPEQFRDLLSGKVGEQQLGRHGKSGLEHHPGWDFALSAPKSVSIMALVMKDERILAAHEKAVTDALTYLEGYAGLRRRVDGKIVHQETGRLLWARFTEHASRELDPHLHTHVVVLNMTNEKEGNPMASLETRAMYLEQMAAGQIYRNSLAHQIREMGYEIDADHRRGMFEIEGVPRAMMKDMSQRAAQIEAHATEHGLEGQAARRRSFYETRGPKQRVSLEELAERWTARAVGYVPELAATQERMVERGDRNLAPAAALSARAGLLGVRNSEEREAVNNLGRILRSALGSHIGEVRLEDVRPAISEHEARRKLLATKEATGDELLARGRTTRKTARLEQSFVQHIALSLGDGPAIATADRLLAILERASLAPEQERALVDAALSNDRVTAIAGVAGAGKSTLVKILAEAAHPDRAFIAIAPTSSAASSLGRTAGIEDRTVASILAHGGHGLSDRHVLVLDEAGQLGNRQALRILEISRRSGARLILLGDDHQTSAIEQGKPFWLMQRMGLPTSHLRESRRQRTGSTKAAVIHARSGEFGLSLDRLDRVVTGETASALARNLVQQWGQLEEKLRSDTNILVLDNAARISVNHEVRKLLKAEGTLPHAEREFSILEPGGMSDEEKRYSRFYQPGQIVIFGRDLGSIGIVRDKEYRVAGTGKSESGRHLVHLADETDRIIKWDPALTRARNVSVFEEDKRHLAQGDRIQWRLATRDLAIKNAERGTVEGMKGSMASVRWDRDGRVQQIDLLRHKHWDHGYAETVFSSQAKTYDRVFILAPIASPLINARNYYTAITRARFNIALWTEDRQQLQMRLEERSGEKSSALEGLSRLTRDSASSFAQRHAATLAEQRRESANERARARASRLDRQLQQDRGGERSITGKASDAALRLVEMFTGFALRESSQFQDRPQVKHQSQERDWETSRGMDR